MKNTTRNIILIFLAVVMLFSMITTTGIIPLVRAEDPFVQTELMENASYDEVYDTDAAGTEAQQDATDTTSETEICNWNPECGEEMAESAASDDALGMTTSNCEIKPEPESESVLEMEPEQEDQFTAETDIPEVISDDDINALPGVSDLMAAQGSLKSIYKFRHYMNGELYYGTIYKIGSNNYSTVSHLHTHRLTYSGKMVPAYCLDQLLSSSGNGVAGTIEESATWQNASSDTKNAIILVLAYAQKLIENRTGYTQLKPYDEIAIQLIIWEILYGRRANTWPYAPTGTCIGGGYYPNDNIQIDAINYPRAIYTAIANNWFNNCTVKAWKAQAQGVQDESEAYNISSTELANGRQLYKDIIKALSVHTMPSFMYETASTANTNKYAMAYNNGVYTRELTDNNGVLTHYFNKPINTPWTENGVTYKITSLSNNRQKLTITTTDASNVNGITFDITGPALNKHDTVGAVIYKSANTSYQSAVSYAEQPTPSTMHAFFALVAVPAGTAKISKTTSDESSKAGFCFHLESNNANVNIYAKTNASGSAYQTVTSGDNPYSDPATKVYTFDGLFDGTYKFTEDLIAAGKTEYYPESITFKIGNTIVGTYRYDNGTIKSDGDGNFFIENIVLSGLSGKQLLITVNNTKKGKLSGVKTTVNNGPVVNFAFNIYRPKGSYAKDCAVYTRTDTDGRLYKTDEDHTEVPQSERIYTYSFVRLLDGKYTIREFDLDPNREGQYEIKSATIIIRDVNGDIIHCYGPYTKENPNDENGELYKYTGSDIFDCVRVNVSGLTGGGTMELNIENGPVSQTSLQIRKISDGEIEGIPFIVEQRPGTSGTWTLIENTQEDPDFYTDENGLIHIYNLVPGAQLRIKEDFSKPILADYLCMGSSQKIITLVQGVNTVTFENRRRATVTIRKTSDDGIVVGVPFNVYYLDRDDTFQLLQESPVYTVATDDPNVGEIILDYDYSFCVGDIIKIEEIPQSENYYPEISPTNGIIQLDSNPENNVVNFHNKVNFNLSLSKICPDGNVEITFDIYIGRAPNLEYYTTVTTQQDPNDTTVGRVTLEDTAGLSYGMWLTIREVMRPEDAEHYICGPNDGVQEIQIHEGENSITFYNTPIVNLCIRKTVPGGNPNGFVFNIKKVLNPNANPEEYVYDDKGNFTTETRVINGQSVDGAIIANWNLQYGEIYRIEEITSATPYYTCISDNPQFITLVTGDNTVSFTNVPNGLTIQKTADDGNIDNIEFYVWEVTNHMPTTPPANAMVVSTGIGNNGVITITDVIVGRTYRIQEKTADSAYTCSPDYAEITIASGSNTVSFHNTLNTILKIKKTSQDGNITGFKFKVEYKQNAETNDWSNLGTYTTNSRGYINLTNIHYGYYYRITEELTAAQQQKYICNTPTKIVQILMPETTVEFENIPLTHLELIKTSSDEKVAGIEFDVELQVQNGEETAFIPFCTAATDTNGKINFDQFDEMTQLYGATIRISERVPEGYMPQDPVIITLTTGNNTVNFNNIRIIGHFSVEKRTPNEQPVANVSFRLWNSDESIVRTGTSGADGVIDFGDLPYGHYYYQETSAPLNLVIPDKTTIWEVDITNTQHVIHVRYNEPNNGGTISVLKKDKNGNPLSGATFLLEYNSGAGWRPIKYGDQTTIFTGRTSSPVDEQGCLITGADGIAVFNRLYINQGGKNITYRLREYAAPEGYILDDSILFEGELLPGAHHYTLIAENELIYGSLKIVKIEKNHPDILLPNAGFRIYNLEDDVVREGYTDDNGELVFDHIPYGSYYYKEFQAPQGYMLDETPHIFNIENDTEIEVTAENEQGSGSITVYKHDQNNRRLSGVTFSLNYSLDGVTWQPVVYSANTVAPGTCSSEGLNENGDLTTDETGMVSFAGLYIGSDENPIQYRIAETATVSGQTLLSGYAFTGTLYELDSPNIEILAYNNRVFVLPHTGSHGFHFIVFGVFTMTGLGCVLLWLAKRKREKEN